SLRASAIQSVTMSLDKLIHARVAPLNGHGKNGASLSFGLADNTHFQDLPPSVVLRMSLASNTQVFVLKTAAALFAQPFSRSIICSESNSSAGDSCAGFGPETSSPRATFEQPSKAPLEMIAKQTSILGFIVSTTDRLQC